MSPYRILSLDGGGIRGLLPVVLLRRLIRTPGLEGLLQSADFVAGTSTGGLLALGIAFGLDLEAMEDLYVKKGPAIFDDSWLDDLLDLGKLKGADYSIEPLRRQLRSLFGKTTLGELSKRVLITAFDLDHGEPAGRTWKPKLFHNFTGPGNDRRELAYKVGLYTASAPTYFPSVDGYVDGGVYANNPSMCALAQTQDRRYQPIPSLEEVTMLSLGTGISQRYIPGDKLDWGYAQWAKPLISLILDGTVGIADFQCGQILRDRYHRLAPVFPQGRTFELDDVKKIGLLQEFANQVPLQKTVKWLQTHWV